MSTFASIRVEGFRRLVDVTVELLPLTVVVGANGCGKSSFLDVWRLLSRAAHGELADGLAERNGFVDVLSRSRPGTSPTGGMRFTIQGNIQFATFEYQLAIRRSGLLYAIESERLSQRSDERTESLIRRSSSGSETADHQFVQQPFAKAVSPNETLLSQATNLNAATDSIQSLIRSVGFYGPIDVSQASAARRPQMLRPITIPGEDGSDLVSLLYSIRESDRDQFEIIEDTLRCAFPDFERLDFPLVAAGTMALAWNDRQFSQPLYAHQLSEGTLRFLWLTTLLLSRKLPTLTLIDEPEVSLHPQLLMLLVDLLREASLRTQLIVATQSDQLIRFLTPQEILIANLENGAAQFAWGNDLDLEHWLKDFTLDQLWTMGVLGGRS